MALALAAPEALVASPPGLINATGAGSWTRRFAKDWRIAGLTERFSRTGFNSIATTRDIVAEINGYFPGGRATRLYIRSPKDIHSPKTGPWVDGPPAAGPGAVWWHPGFPGSDLDYEPYGETVEFDGPSELIEPGGLSDYEWPDDAGQLESDRQGLDPDAESTGVEKQRQLLAQLLHGREVCQTSLSPGTEYDLSVLIAIPRDGERGYCFPRI